MSHPHQQILDAVSLAFGFQEKPSPGPSPSHCDECAECYDYIIRLNPSDVTLEDIHERWQFGFCGEEYRKYLFPGVCRECLGREIPDIELLFSYIDRMGTFSEVQKGGVSKLYQYLFDCGFALDDESLHRDLRDRLKTIKSEQDESPNLDSAIAPSK